MVGGMCSSVATMWHSQCGYAASDITSSIFNFVLCVRSFFIYFFHLVSVTQNIDRTLKSN